MTSSEKHHLQHIALTEIIGILMKIILGYCAHDIFKYICFKW